MVISILLLLFIKSSEGIITRYTSGLIIDEEFEGLNKNKLNILNSFSEN